MDEEQIRAQIAQLQKQLEAKLGKGDSRTSPENYTLDQDFDETTNQMSGNFGMDISDPKASKYFQTLLDKSSELNVEEQGFFDAYVAAAEAKKAKKEKGWEDPTSWDEDLDSDGGNFLTAIQASIADAEKDPAGDKEVVMAKTTATTEEPAPASAPQEDVDVMGMAKKLNTMPEGMSGDRLAPRSDAGEPATKSMAVDDKTLESAFQVAHGASFDPKSRVDIAKRQKLEEILLDNPDLTPRQAAVRIWQMEG